MKIYGPSEISRPFKIKKKVEVTGSDRKLKYKQIILKPEVIFQTASHVKTSIFGLIWRVLTQFNDIEEISCLFYEIRNGVNVFEHSGDES